MQCRYCNSSELMQISYNYYECRTCGKLNFEGKADGRKKSAIGEIYFVIGVVAAALVITILILLFVTAANKRDKSATTDNGNVKVKVQQQSRK